MAEVCPDAWLLNYTNPMAMLVLGDLQRLAAARRSSGSATRSRTPRASWPSSSACRFEEVTFLGAGRQPPGLHPALRARRREPLPGARRGDRARPRAAAPGAGRDLPAPSATSRPSRASTPPSTCPGSCATTTRSSGCGSRSATTCDAARRTWPSTSATASASRRGEPLRDRARDRVRAADHPLDGHRRPPRVVYGNVEQQRPDRQPARAAPASRCPCAVDASGVQPDPRRRAAAAAARRSTGLSSTSAS